MYGKVTDPKTGISITVFDCGFLDYAIQIDGPNGSTIGWCPHGLSHEDYGSDRAEWQSPGVTQPWDEDRWNETILDEFFELLDAFVGIETLEEMGLISRGEML